MGPLNLVDADTGAILSDRAVSITNGRIQAVVLASDVPQESRTAMVKPAGTFAMPALWDMHAVLTRYAPALEYPLYIAHGVTRLRNIVRCPAEGTVNLYPCAAGEAAWNARVVEGSLLGPVVMGSGSYPVTGPERRHRDAPVAFAAVDRSQAEEVVRTLAAGSRPTDHIKIYDGLPRESFFAMMAEAARRGIEVSGHVPVSIKLQEAVAAGMKAIAHARVLPIACSSREDEIMSLRAGNVPSTGWMAIAIESYDREKCASLWSDMRARNTYLSPTLITRFNETKRGLRELSSDRATVAATPWLLQLIWQEDASAVQGRTEADDQIFDRYYEAAAARTADAAHAGVNLLLGSDTNDVYVAPGIGLHQEVELWRRAGISTDVILRAATVTPARYFRQEAQFARIAPGYVADILFTDRNPQHDLATLRDPAAVLHEGRLYDRAALQQAVKSAREAAHSWRYPVHFIRDLLRNPLGFAN
jgi:hypothetical protein